MSSPPRRHLSQQVSFLRGVVKAKDPNGASLSGIAQPIGVLPNGAVVLAEISGVHIKTAFNGASTDLLDIGYDLTYKSDGTSLTADPDAFATDLDVSAQGRVYVDESSADWYVDADRRGMPVTATYTDTSGGAVTSGEAVVFIGYIGGE